MRRNRTEPRLRVELHAGWRDVSSENPEGGPTYQRLSPPATGVLQFSIALYRGGPEPRPSPTDLIEIASQTRDLGQLFETGSGKCAFGTYGTAVCRAEQFPRSQVWYLSNGRDFIIATHIFDEEPDSSEVREGQEIVARAKLAG